MIKNRPADVGDAGSIRGSGRSPEGEHGNPLQYSLLFPGKSPWIDEPGKLQSMGSQRVGYDRVAKYSTQHIKLNRGATC